MTVTVTYVDNTPDLFDPDSSTVNGTYMNALNRLAFVIGGAGDKRVIEVGPTGTPSETAVGSYNGQLREMTGADSIVVAG